MPRQLAWSRRWGALLGLLTLGACGRVGFGNVSPEDYVGASGHSGQGGAGAAAQGGQSGNAGEAGAAGAAGGGQSGAAGSAGAAGTAGAAGAAGSAGAAGTAGAAGGAFCPPDCSMPTLVAEDFEGAMPGTLRSSGLPLVELVDSPVHRGTQALHAVQAQAQAQAGLDFPITPITAGTLYFRGYVYVPVAVATTGIKVMDFGTAYGPLTDINVSQNQIVDLFMHPTGITATSAAGVVPFGRWCCMQVTLVVSSTVGSVDVSLDGVTVMTRTGLNTLAPGGVTGMGVGALWTRVNQTNAAVYWDDIVLAQQPVPCQ